MPFNEALFWVGITVFGTGLYFVIERASKGVRWLAGLTTLCGLVATAYSIYAHGHPSAPMPPLWIYLLVLTWLLVGADIYSRGHQSQGPRPEPYKNSNPSQQSALASATPSRQIVTMSVEQLIALFMRGETTSDGQRLVKPYIGMWLTVSGEVSDVRESSITFKGRSFTTKNGLITHFSKTNRDALSILRPGNVVAVIGKIETVSQFDVTLEECEIIS